GSGEHYWICGCPTPVDSSSPVVEGVRREIPCFETDNQLRRENSKAHSGAHAGGFSGGRYLPHVRFDGSLPVDVSGARTIQSEDGLDWTCNSWRGGICHQTRPGYCETRRGGRASSSRSSR